MMVCGNCAGGERSFLCTHAMSPQNVLGPPVGTVRRSYPVKGLVAVLFSSGVGILGVDDHTDRASTTGSCEVLLVAVARVGDAVVAVF